LLGTIAYIRVGIAQCVQEQRRVAIVPTSPSRLTASRF
jgi:hypothetical protein